MVNAVAPAVAPAALNAEVGTAGKDTVPSALPLFTTAAQVSLFTEPVKVIVPELAA